MDFDFKGLLLYGGDGLMVWSDKDIDPCVRPGVRLKSPVHQISSQYHDKGIFAEDQDTVRHLNSRFLAVADWRHTVSTLRQWLVFVRRWDGGQLVPDQADPKRLF